MIRMQHIIDNNKVLLTLVFDSSVLKHLDARCDDYLLLLQSLHQVKYFTLIKADTGYRITRVLGRKKCYQINISHRYTLLDEFELSECIYFKKNNRSIKIKLK